MENKVAKECIFIKHIKHVVLVSSHNNFNESMNYSDRIILPLSVSLEIRILNLPLPPIFLLSPERSMYDSLHCSVLEFTAEEDYIYLPFWMYNTLGYRSINKSYGDFKSGYGIKLYAAPYKQTPLSYYIPKCVSIEIYIEDQAITDEIKSKLKNYSLFTEDKEIPVQIKNSVIYILVSKVLPENVAMVSSDFSIEFSQKYKKFSKKNESHKVSEKLRKIGLDVLPHRPERYPKFLMDIMNKTPKRNIEIAKNRSKTHHLPLLVFEVNKDVKTYSKSAIKRQVKIKSSKNNDTPNVNSSLSRDFDNLNSPKLLTFNLPSLGNDIKHPLKPIQNKFLKKWFKTNRKVNSSNIIDFTPLEALGYYKIIKNA